MTEKEFAHVCPAQAQFTDAVAARDRWAHGLAVTPSCIVQDDDGTWMADTGEYACPVFYCPWCGEQLVEVLR